MADHEPKLMTEEQLNMVTAGIAIAVLNGKDGPEEHIMAHLLGHIQAQDRIIKRLSGHLS